MPDPISLAAGYFLLKTAVSMGMTLGEDVGANKIGFELMKSVAGNFYSDILKFSGQKAWSGIASRLRSEYTSNNPLNHDLQKAIRKAQVEATISACESCSDDLKLQDATFFDKLRNKLSLNEDERWLKNVVQSLTINLAEIKDKDYIPPTITDDIDVLKIADNRNYPLTAESVQSLVNSIKEQTIIEIRFGSPPSPSQKQIASDLEQKIYNGWTKEFQGETISVDWYKLLCDRFNEEYKENERVNAALQKAFFQDIKSDLAGKFTQFSENHFEELGGQILSKLESIEGKQDRLYNFVEIFKDENDRKLTEALAILKTSVSEINKFTAEKAEETQNVIHDAKSEIIREFKTQNKELIGQVDKKLASHDEEIQLKIEETLKQSANFRRNILAKRDLTIIEKLFGRQRIPFFDKIFGKLTAQEEFLVSLKERYATRYLNKLDGRFEITLMVSDDLESEVRREYTGIYEGHGQLNEAFEYMRNAFRDANRLLIVGEPGVGKTVLLLKFANDLLDKTIENLNSRPELRLDDIKEPIPVIFNLASWSEDYASFRDWLIAMLKTGEGLSEAFADELLSNKKIFLLLDGLDELAKNETPETAPAIRAKCFDSIVGFLKGGQKAVICCRKDEYWQIRKDIGQDDEEQRRKMPEVFVKNLDINQIKNALERASKTDVDRESALNILKLLEYEKSGVFLKILGVPFYFTTALEVFDSSVMKERNFPVDEQGLKDYLVERLIVEKLEISPPNPKQFRYEYSFKWLKWLAKNLKKKDKVIFELADLQPSDLRRPWIFKFLYGFLIYFIITSCFIVSIWVSSLFQNNAPKFFNYFSSEFTNITLSFIVMALLIYWLLAFFLLPFCLLYSFRTKTISTEDFSRFSLQPLLKWKIIKAILFTSFLYSSIMALVMLPLFILSTIIDPPAIDPTRPSRVDASIVIGISLWVFLFTFVERISNYARAINSFGNLRADYQRLKTGIIYNSVRGTIVLCFCLAVTGVAYFVNTALITYPSILILVLLISALFQHIILRLCLTAFRVIPLRYATFLNYLAKARILEKDGGFWRFRHQELQDYFAKLP